MIAPIQSNLVALKDYSVGEQFVYNGLLYKATAAITQGGTITIDGNCSLADSITDQINAIFPIIPVGSTTGIAVNAVPNDNYFGISIFTSASLSDNNRMFIEWDGRNNELRLRNYVNGTKQKENTITMNDIMRAKNEILRNIDHDMIR